MSEKNVKFVVVGDAGENCTYENLTKAFRLILEGAEPVAMERIDTGWERTDC